MTRQARSALRGTIATAVALAVAFATATIIAVLDWQLNPGGIFHDDLSDEFHLCYFRDFCAQAEAPTRHS